MKRYSSNAQINQHRYIKKWTEVVEHPQIESQSSVNDQFFGDFAAPGDIRHQFCTTKTKSRTKGLFHVKYDSVVD